MVRVILLCLSIVALSLFCGQAKAASCATPCTKNQILTDIATNWPDNNTNIVTPAILRSQMLEIVQSYYDTNGSPSANCSAHQWISGLPTVSSITCLQPSFSDISGSITPTQCPNPTASTTGCVESLVAVTSKWINTISTSGVPSATQPAFSDISGTLASTQLPNPLVMQTIASPGTPSAGFANVYVNATNKNLVVNNDAAASSVTVYPQTGSASQFINAISSAGAITFGTTLGTAAFINTGTSGATIGLLNAANTWSALQIFNPNDFAIAGATSGTLTLNCAAICGSHTVTFPDGSTDFSSTGGTSQVVQQSSSGAALTVGQLASTNLSDVTTPTAWTPSDGSGATLVLTSITALYTKVGKTVTAQFRLTYPSTGSSATATIAGLPVAASASAPALGFTSGNCISSATNNTHLEILLVGSATSFTFFNIGGTNPTNANLSTGVVSCQLTYIST